jgi:NitT/TauT family transport system substrate-binding protein
MKLTTGFKFFVILLLVGGIVGGLRIFKPEIFQKKEGSKEVKAETNTTKSKKSKGVKPDLTLGINTWSGFAPIVWLNGGLDPNENSQLYQKYGIKLQIKINDVFDDSRNNFKTDNYNLVYCTTDVLPIEMGVGSGMVEAEAKQFIQVDWSRGGDAIVVRKGINTVADLKGKTISVALGTASHSLLIKVLESNGLTMNDVQVKLVSDGIESAKAFKAEEVDAAVVWSPDDLDCVDAVAGSKVLVNTKVATHIIADGILVKDAFLQENKDLIVKFATAWLEASGKINNSDVLAKEAAEVCHLAWDMPADFFYSGIKNVRLTTLGDNKNFFELNTDYQGITGDQLYTKMSQVYSKLNLTKSPLSWNRVSTTEVIEVINLSLYQEAESNIKFSTVTEEVKKKAAISNKQVTINFSTNSSTLSDDAKATIDMEFVNTAKTFANARIRIEGNTDAVGNAAYNKTLSFKRAQAVADYLANAYNFDPNRFIVIGNGMTKAVAAGETGANEVYRRTDFQLVEE